MAEKQASVNAAAGSQGTKEIRLALNSHTDFDTLVKVLREVLVVPELPGIRGCRPCLSGLDRFIIEDPAMRNIR
jgi:hypothetical protein